MKEGMFCFKFLRKNEVKSIESDVANLSRMQCDSSESSDGHLSSALDIKTHSVSYEQSSLVQPYTSKHAPEQAVEETPGHLFKGEPACVCALERHESNQNAESTCLGGGTQLSTVGYGQTEADEDAIANYDYPFENLVFEGGGNKGMAYVGALKVLEEAGVARNIKRVCGSSVGAIMASLVAVGCTSQDMLAFAEGDLRKILTDHHCGYCSLLPNLLTGFGWNPGKKLVRWFGEQLKERTGNADITFKEVLQLHGRELCVVTTNLSLMSTEYFHPKTTPNTPVRTAVRMSVALPGIFQSVLYRMGADHDDVYVDGGLLCNYPIHAFDGWWLSMDPRDSFFKRLQPLESYPKLFSKSQSTLKQKPSL